MDQSDDVDKAMREATRGGIEYVQTGRAPVLSICDDDGPFVIERYGRAIEVVAEALVAWEMLSGEEVSVIVEESLGRAGVL